MSPNKSSIRSLVPSIVAPKRWLVVIISMGMLFGVVRHNSTLSTRQCAFSFGSYRGHEYSTLGTVGTPTCLVESKWMKVQQHSVQLAAGSGPIISDWLWIDYHDRINVLVEDETGGLERRFLVFQQTKYALEGRMSLAIIGGIIEPGEEPEVAARREVEEEMNGMQCDNFHFLGRFRTDVNRGMGWVNSFLATRCSRNNKPPLERRTGSNAEEVGAADTERQDIKSMSITDLREAARMAQFLEVQWSNTVALALLHPELTD